MDPMSSGRRYRCRSGTKLTFPVRYRNINLVGRPVVVNKAASWRSGDLPLIFRESGAPKADGVADHATAEAEILQVGISIGLEFGDSGTIVRLGQIASAACDAYRRLLWSRPRPGAYALLEQGARKAGIRQEARVEAEQFLPQARTLDPSDKT